MKSKLLLLSQQTAAAALVLLSAVSTANAVDYIITVGVDQTVMVNAGDRFLVDLGAARSYSCEAVPQDPDTDFDWDPMVVGTTAMTPETITARQAGTIVPQIGGETGGNADNRLTLTPTTSDRFAITVANTEATGENVRVRCVATTLFGGYNTNVNDFNFLELTNIGNMDISGTVTAIDFDGTVVVDSQAFTVPAQRRVDVDLHSATGPDRFGIVRVTHDGPLGTLQGNVSQYSGEVTNFSLSTSNPLVPFDQKP